MVGYDSNRAHGSPLDAELGHAGAQSTGFEEQEVGGASGPFDSPTSMIEDANDVFLLYFLEALNQRWGLFQRLVKAIHYSQDAALTVDNRALDDVSQFPYISRPGVRLQTLHGPGS